MRVHLLTLIVLTGPLAALAPAADHEVWKPEYESAALEAQATGRPLLIHFYADWCGPCRQMEARVLNQPSIRDGLRERVVAVKVNYDRRADLVNRFSVGALPCDLLVGCDGEVLMRTTGYVAEMTYVERIARLAPVTPSPFPATYNSVVNAQQLGAVQHVGTMLLVASGQWSSIPLESGLRTAFETR